MKKLIKPLIGVGVALVILVVAVVLLALGAIDSITKTAVERGGTYALGVPTTLEKADVKLTKGSLELASLNVANPEGFTTPHFMALSSGLADADVQSIMSDRMRIEEIVLDGLDINLEKSASGSNYGKILENLEKLSPKDPDAQPKQDPEKKGPALVIDRLVIRNVAVHADVVPLPGVSSEATRVNVNLSEIVLTEIGDGAKPMEIAEVVAVVVQAVMQAVVEAAGDQLPGEILNGLESSLAGLGDLSDLGIGVAAKFGDQAVEIIGDLGKEAEKALEGAADEVGGAVDDIKDEIGKGIGGLLGGD